MTAQPSTAQPTIPTFSLATLRATLTDLKAQEPERNGRWDRAAMIVALRSIKPGYAAGWWVESESEAHKWYWVVQVPSGNWTCICADFTQRGGPCKHALAVRLVRACQEREGIIEPVVFPTERYNPEDRFELTTKGEACLSDSDTSGGPAASPPLGDSWGVCRTCGDIGWIGYSGQGACCIG